MSFGVNTATATSPWDEQVEAGGNVRFHDRQFDIEAVKLLPGEYFATADNMMLVTLLGSCVSACISDRLLGLGGMNHFMLPDSEQSGAAGSARYGSYAMEVLINELIKLGAARNRLEAKIFGGGNVLKGFTVANVGSRNIEFARNYLAAENIPIVAEDVGDTCPRKVHYFPATGRTMVKRLASVHSGELSQEQAYSMRLQKQPVTGEVELF